MARRRRKDKGVKPGDAALIEANRAEPKVHNVDPLILGFEDTSSPLYSAFHPGALGLDYRQLIAMSRVPVISGIINTRINQVADFCMPQSSPYELGFRVALRDRKAKMTAAAERRSTEIENVLMVAGGRWGPGNMELAVRAMMRDSLTYDQLNAEVLHNRLGKPCGYVPSDATTIRLAKPKDAARARGQAWPEPGEPEMVQRDSTGRVVAEFTRDEMIWGIRRPRTLQAIGRYGFPELDELVVVITDLVNAETFNSVNFTNGVHANHIIAVMSTMDGKVWGAFRRSVTAMLTGPRNAARTPFIQLDPRMHEDIKAVSLSETNKDMEYSQWINWRVKLAHLVYGMDPAENGLIYGNEGQTSALSTQGPGDRIVASKERGLRPILRSLGWWFTTWIVQPLDPDFMMEFGGFGAMSEIERHKLAMEAVKTYKTPNELRDEHDLERLDSEIADLPLSQEFASAAMSARDGAAPPGGAPGEGEDDEPFDGAMPPDDQQSGFMDADTIKGTRWNSVDDWTRQLVKSGEQALADGRLVRKGPRRPGARRAMVPAPSHHSGVRAWIVEAA